MKKPRPCAPRALYIRTPAERARVEAAVEAREVWMAFGPDAGTCGHRHLTAGEAARCSDADPARPAVGRLKRPPPIVVPPARPVWTRNDTYIAVYLLLIVFGLVALLRA